MQTIETMRRNRVGNVVHFPNPMVFKFNYDGFALTHMHMEERRSIKHLLYRKFDIELIFLEVGMLIILFINKPMVVNGQIIS